MHNRRIFLKNLTHIAAASMVGVPLLSHAAVPVDVKDPQAIALGYVADSRKADQAKFPKHDATQQCTVCALYQGKPGDVSGGCPLFAGKVVAAGGWCSAFIKKA